MRALYRTIEGTSGDWSPEADDVFEGGGLR